MRAAVGVRVERELLKTFKNLSNRKAFLNKETPYGSLGNELETALKNHITTMEQELNGGQNAATDRP